MSLASLDVPPLPSAVPSATQPPAKPSSATHTIERRCGLSRYEFEQEYCLPRRPVILTDATAAWAAREWTPAKLRSRVGHREIEFRGGSGKVRFGDLIDQVESSTDDAPAPYGRNIHVFRDLPEVADDIRPRIEYCLPDWKSSRLIPRNFGFENGLEEMFFGGKGTKFPALHVDYWGMDAYLSQLYGEKDVMVMAPDQSPYLYATPENPIWCPIENLENPDLSRYPLFAQATGIRFALKPGETLFCPNGWWHTTSMPGISITVVTANWCRANWPSLIKDYVRTNLKGRPTKTRLVAAYLRAAGVALGLRDRYLLGL